MCEIVSNIHEYIILLLQHVFNLLRELFGLYTAEHTISYVRSALSQNSYMNYRTIFLSKM